MTFVIIAVVAVLAVLLLLVGEHFDIRPAVLFAGYLSALILGSSGLAHLYLH